MLSGRMDRPRGTAGAEGGCVFCAIAAGSAPAWIVHEERSFLAFLDRFPYTRGHLLVVPREHVDRLTELPSADRAGYLGAITEVCRRVERLTTHYNVALNQGALAGQVVFHLHFHIIPRYGETNPFRVRGRGPIDPKDAAVVQELLRRP